MSDLHVHNLSRTEQAVLANWEESAKQGQLSLWIMLSLKHGAKHRAQVSEFIEGATAGIIIPEDNSLYRALRRFKNQKLVTHYLQPSKNGGPNLKVYKLTESGHGVLTAFLERNIILPFYDPRLRRLIQKR